MDKIERFINGYEYNSSYCNMAELINDLKQKTEIEEICKENSLNLILLRSLLKLKLKGLTNTGVAQELNVHRITIQRYMDTLRKLDKEKFERIYLYIIQKENENNKDIFVKIVIKSL